MLQQTNIFLIWNEKNLPSRYFFIPSGTLKERELFVLQSVSNKQFTFDQDDEDHLNIWRIKAAISAKDTWIPKSAGTRWAGKLLRFEVKSLDHFVYSNGKIQLEFIQVGGA